MTRAQRFAATFLDLGRMHGKPELLTLAAEIDETFVQRGREMTTTDENAALDAAAATFHTQELTLKTTDVHGRPIVSKHRALEIAVREDAEEREVITIRPSDTRELTGAEIDYLIHDDLDYLTAPSPSRAR